MIVVIMSISLAEMKDYDNQTLDIISNDDTANPTGLLHDTIIIFDDASDKELLKII